MTSIGYIVNFIQYNTTLEVPLEYLRPFPLSVLEQKKINERQMEPVLNIIIPDNLKINPTDTEAVSFF